MWIIVWQDFMSYKFYQIASLRDNVRTIHIWLFIIEFWLKIIQPVITSIMTALEMVYWPCCYLSRCGKSRSHCDICVDEHHLSMSQSPLPIPLVIRQRRPDIQSQRNTEVKEPCSNFLVEMFLTWETVWKQINHDITMSWSNSWNITVISLMMLYKMWSFWHSEYICIDLPEIEEIWIVICHCWFANTLLVFLEVASRGGVTVFKTYANN